VPRNFVAAHTDEGYAEAATGPTGTGRRATELLKKLVKQEGCKGRSIEDAPRNGQHDVKLKFAVNEPASFFHLLDSISLWDIHAMGAIRRYYENMFGLSDEDERLLRNYRKIRRKYPWKMLDSDFYPSKSIEQALKKCGKRLNETEHSKLKTIIDNFYPAFHKIFIGWKNALLKRKKSLEKEVRRHSLKGLFSEMAKFYESKGRPKTVYVHLVVNPSKHSCGGGANIEPRNHVTLEPANLEGCREGAVLDDIAVIAHEVLHIIENKSNKTKWNEFMSFAKKMGLDESMLRESIADTLVPDGYLALKYKLIDETKIPKFNRLGAISAHEKSKPSRHYGMFRQKLSAALYPLTESQMKRGMSLFEGDYVERCVEKYLLMKSKT
jgi:hypothetical protein